MENQLKNSREFKILYDWLQISRRPNQNTSEDIQLLMDLIDIPVTSEEISFLANELASTSNKLEKADFINYFFVPEEKKKQSEKQVLAAFKFVANNQNVISTSKLKECLLQEGFSEQSAELVLKQAGQWEKAIGVFDYKSFVTENFQQK